MSSEPDSSLDIYETVRLRQMLPRLKSAILPKHRPEMLYIGCSDARLDPVEDMGIPQGKALIYRNITGRVPEAPDVGALDMAAIAATGQIPEGVSMGAAVEFFLNHVPSPGKGKTKHIVVSAHMHCGGINECLNEPNLKDTYLPYYVASLLQPIKSFVEALTDPLKDTKLRKMEEESVRQSLKRLRHYPGVEEAEREHCLELHGWVLDTTEQRAIMELDEKAGTFHRLGDTLPKRRGGRGAGR